MEKKRATWAANATPRHGQPSAASVSHHILVAKGVGLSNGGVRIVADNSSRVVCSNNKQVSAAATM